MNEFVRGTVPKVKMHYQPVLCMHCDKAPCVEACPIENAIYKRDDGLVIIDPTKCNGCKNCVNVCPYNALYFNEDLNIAQKCTGCAHLLDNGWKVPRCVDACPTEALKFGEESELRDLIKKGESPRPEFGTRPRLYYLNMPSRFVAGMVYDPAEEEVVIDAVCTLSDVKNGDKFTIKTDSFGDFWFEGLEVSEFSLKIVKDEKAKTIGPINTEKDVNLGDIPL
jgi:Fe-S-cluster-containing dehydrogenase component